MTRRRGYLWLTLLLLAATGVLVAMQPRGGYPKLPPVSDNPDSLPQVDTTRLSALSETRWPQKKHKPLVVELNSADSLDLVQLYNVGPVIAQRILRYRERLGGYVNIQQLREVHGIDSTRYADMQPHLTVDTAVVRRMDLNTADINQLKKHPYLDYYQAKAIVRQREQRGPYHSVADLQDIPLIDPTTYTLIQHYLTCSLQPNR